MHFSEKVIRFNRDLKFDHNLPPGIKIMNPFVENEAALEISSLFYKKFYHDTNHRKIILGINPGRFGAGVTGIPFTDTKRLKEDCGIHFPGMSTHEISSAFIYEMIAAYGGTRVFFSDFYIGAVCPLGFVTVGKTNKEKNYNYFDSKALLERVEPFIIASLERQMEFGIDRDICFCLGNNKNYKFLMGLNNTYHYFNKIIPLEHPRYIMQYKLKQKEKYIEKYLNAYQFSGN